MESNPILNSPYLEPEYHYATAQDGSLDYQNIKKHRRIFTPEIQVIPEKQKGQKEAFDVNEASLEYESHLINLTRNEVEKWRKEAYPSVSKVTSELLHYWFLNPDRHETKQMFFAQREAVETAIWLNEVAYRTNAGQNILNKISEQWKDVSDNPAEQLPRIAFKMATGTGKTVVMGALILYNFLNRQVHKQDTRFSDYFLIVAPSITIRDRLHVLKVDQKNKFDRTDYYSKNERDLIPPQFEKNIDGLNARIVITNYHAFMPRTLQGNKRGVSDGRIIGYDEKGKKIVQEAKESYDQVFKRVLGSFRKGRRLLILNDEAHHCYKPKSKGRTNDYEGSNENEKAAVWSTGLKELNSRFKIRNIYDLSATPYYLQGSGYPAYTLFGWVVSDFGLIEAIESGLVKIPYLPEEDDTQQIEGPILKNLYEHAKDGLPKKGQRKKKSEAKQEGVKYTEQPPNLPGLVKGALDQFYNHYREYDQNIRKKGEAGADIFTRPPVFIVVCNNTSVSKEVYKFIAGYEYEDEEGNKYIQQGAFDILSNFDQSGIKKQKPPSILIDSESLDEDDQVNKEFKKIFAPEIESFKRDYAKDYGQGAADRLTEGDILREVVNTVGEPGKLGGHIRCVVSVSMLTEGWDANTVTHIMGLRAFGSQLLCEQVAGRALRRRSYYLQGYDKNGQPATDKRKIVKYKFPPEYAHIIGVPFQMFKGGQTTVVEPPEMTLIKPVHKREKDFEIEFPNVEGYRIDVPGDILNYDLNSIDMYEFDGSQYPRTTILGNAFSDNREELKVESVLEKRDNEIIYMLTKDLLQYKFSDDENRPKYELFNQLKIIVQEWYNGKVKLLNISEPAYKRLLYYENPKTICDHIFKAINPEHNSEEFIRPVLNHYNPWGSTRYAHGNTSKDTYDTIKSHINKVVMDSEWEGICAKTLEELDQVVSYVKNQFLGFTIPYIKDGEEHMYYTDFIARVKTNSGESVNLMIEITGMNKEKAAKKWYVENRWLPAVNAVREKYNYDRWEFIEVANDIRDIRNQLIDKIKSMD
ncbi:MAG: DEAD/DEAH box helicase family protein [Bacteroidales bacterium]|nr:DEAD/DEAH box helicase family protein [Bacteroidales bacterium]